MRKVFKDLEGKRFNFITVIKKSTDNQQDIIKNRWICKCDCGKEIKVRAAQLFYGQQSCGCKRTIDLTGQKFGELSVIERFIDDSTSDALWLCNCKCGKTKKFTSSHLRKGASKSCGCLAWKGHKEIGGTFFNRIRNSAKTRELEFNITIEQIWDLFIKQNRKCAFTGIVLNFESKCEYRDGTASLDRIDSNKGYTIDNVQWVHKDINYMKQDNSDEEFINYCKLVANYRN